MRSKINRTDEQMYRRHSIPTLRSFGYWCLRCIYPLHVYDCVLVGNRVEWITQKTKQNVYNQLKEKVPIDSLVDAKENRREIKRDHRHCSKSFLR